MSNSDRPAAQAILEVLRDRGPQGATFDELYQMLSDRGTPTTVRELRQFLTTLVAEGAVDSGTRPSEGGRPAKTYLDPELNPQQRIFNFQDIRTREEVGRDLLTPTELRRLKDEHGFLAQIGVDHLSRDRQVEAVRDAVPQLAQEEPVTLILDFAEWVVNRLRALRREYFDALGRSRDEAEKRHQEFDFEANIARIYFYDLLRLHRGLSSVDRILDIQVDRWLDAKVRDDEVISFDRSRAEPVLRSRVVGSRVLELEQNLEYFTEHDSDHNNAIVAATDASMIPVTVKTRPAGSYELPETLTIFTGAAAQMQRTAGTLKPLVDYDLDPGFLKTRDEVQAAEQGWMITESIQEIIGEGHAKYAISAAQEFRQYRRDADVLLNRISWKGMPGLQPPRADVLVRDGRLYPLVHRIRDYEAGGLYGRIVRNEIQEFTEVCRRVLDDYDYLTYGAFVKRPVQYFLAPLVFWYCHERMGFKDRVPLSSIFQPKLGDSLLSYILLRKFLEGRKPSSNTFATTFRVLRRYSDLALVEELPQISEAGSQRLVDEAVERDWITFFRQRRAERQRLWDERRTEIPPIPEREYSALRFLCQRVGVLMGFALPADGRFISKLPYRLPRCEVLVDLGREPSDRAEPYRRLLAALTEPDTLVPDDDHPDGSSMQLIIPWVCREAHRAAVFADDIYRRELERRLMDTVRDIERTIRRLGPATTL